MPPGADGLDGEPAPGQRGACDVVVLVHVHCREFVVVQAGAPHRFPIEPEPQRLDEMQLAARVRTQANQVPGIRRDLGFEEHDVEQLNPGA